MPTSLSLSFSDCSENEPTPARAEKSLGKVFPHAAHAEILKRGVPVDPHRYRALFPERWTAFLKAHHRSCEEVAVFYGVTYRTAMNWWEGVNRPSGDRVALAALNNPEGFRTFLGSVS